MIHDLKTWPKYFIPIVTGIKTFEIRINDRDFKARDILHLQEYDPDTNKYTGQALSMQVSFIMELDMFGLKNTVAMGIVPYFNKETNDADNRKKLARILYELPDSEMMAVMDEMHSMLNSNK